MPINFHQISYIVLHPLVLSCVLALISFFTIPHLLTLGPGPFLATIDESGYAFACVILFILVEFWLGLGLLAAAARYYGFSLHSELSNQLGEDQLKQSTFMQLLIIVFGSTPCPLDEVLLCAHNFTVYTLAQLAHSVLLLRVHANPNSRRACWLFAAGLVLHIGSCSWIGSRLGLSKLCVLHYEGLFMLQAYTPQQGGTSQLRLKILVRMGRAVQWSHLGVCYSELIPINYWNVFLCLKIQYHASRCSEHFKRYHWYLHEVQAFRKRYIAEDKLADEPADDCAVCLEQLVTDWCRLSCRHSFHLACVSKWLLVTSDRRCPVCRELFLPKVTPEPLTVWTCLELAKSLVGWRSVTT